MRVQESDCIKIVAAKRYRDNKDVLTGDEKPDHWPASQQELREYVAEEQDAIWWAPWRTHD